MHLCEHDGYHMCGGCCWQQHGGGGVMTAGVWGWWWGGEGKQRGVWHHDPAPAGGLGCLAVDWGTAGCQVGSGKMMKAARGGGVHKCP